MSSEVPTTTFTSSAVVRLYLPWLCVGFLLSLSLPFHSRLSAIHSQDHRIDEASVYTQPETRNDARNNRNLVTRKPWVPEMSYDDGESASAVGDQREFTSSTENGKFGEIGTNLMRDESIMPASAVIRGMGRSGRGGREKKRLGGRGGKGVDAYETSSSSSSSSTIALEPQQEEINTGNCIDKYSHI